MVQAIIDLHTSVEDKATLEEGELPPAHGVALKLTLSIFQAAHMESRSWN